MSQSFSVGDLVTADPASFSQARGVYKIEKAPRNAREVNYVAKPVDPATGELIVGGRGLRGPAYCFNAYDPEKDPAGVGVTEIPYVPVPDAGVVVRVNGIPKIDPADLYVVMGYARQPNAAKLVKLGGEGGRYYPSVPVATLTVVPVESLAEYLIERL